MLLWPCLAMRSTDNASAIVIDIVALPRIRARIAVLRPWRRDCPFRPLPSIGESVDGFRLERPLSDGEQSRSFLARGGPSGDGRFALKFPKPGILADHVARESFVRELLIGARVKSPFVVEILQLPPESQSRVYTVMPFYDGRTLEAVLRAGPMSYFAGLAVAAKLACAAG